MFCGPVTLYLLNCITENIQLNEGLMLGLPVLNHGSPKFLWQKAIPVVVGWFSGHAWKNNNKWYT
jgi:hypothetical protein